MGTTTLLGGQETAIICNCQGLAQTLAELKVINVCTSLGQHRSRHAWKADQKRKKKEMPLPFLRQLGWACVIAGSQCLIPGQASGCAVRLHLGTALMLRSLIRVMKESRNHSECFSLWKYIIYVHCMLQGEGKSHRGIGIKWHKTITKNHVDVLRNYSPNSQLRTMNFYFACCSSFYFFPSYTF